MSKHQKITPAQTAAPVIKRRDELVFAPLSTGADTGSSDMVSTLRSIKAYVDLPDDKALEGELKNKLAGKMFTLENMANSDYHRRAKGLRRSSAAREAVSGKLAKAQGLYEFSESTKYSDFKDLSEMWNVYASAAYELADSSSSSGCPETMTLIQYKNHLLVSELELIGATLRIVHSSNPGNVGLEGIVLDESENSIKIITEANKIKNLPKNVCTLKIKIPHKREILIFGPDIAGVGRTGSVFRSDLSVMRKRSIHPLVYS